MRIAREHWMEWAGTVDAGRLVFIDEAAAKTNMTRLWGWAGVGERAFDAAPHGHWATRTMISSLRSDGSTACMAVDAATDTDVFLAFVRTTLVPSLREGDIVVLDNLRPHHSPEVARLIREAGAEVKYLPPYSPDLNPIEQMWSKVKASLRRAEARTSSRLHKAIRAALGEVTAEDAVSWFENCGYTFS